LTDEEEIATEMTLRAFRAASDATAFRLLDGLGDDGASVDDLSRASGLGRFATLERVTELVQAGLASHPAGSDRVHATRLGRGVAGVLGSVRDRFAGKIADRRPALERDEERRR
jgi:hypothetical protein